MISIGENRVLDIPDRTDRSHALLPHAAEFSGRQTERDEVTLLGHDLDARTRGACHLSTLARLQFDVVNHRTQRDELERKRVTQTDIGIPSRNHGVTHLEPTGMENVPLFAIRVVEECNVG